MPVRNQAHDVSVLFLQLLVSFGEGYLKYGNLLFHVRMKIPSCKREEMESHLTCHDDTGSVKKTILVNPK